MSRSLSDSGLSPSCSKWLLVNQVLRTNRIGVLAIQEAHITCMQADELNTIFDGLMKVFVSPDPLAPTAARGVAFAVNLRVCSADRLEFIERVPGRALELKLTRRRGTRMSLLNVYAPNVATDNKVFWDELRLAYDGSRTGKPDVLLGDFNVVEEALDRAPARADDERAVMALSSLVSGLALLDGWRMQNGTLRSFSFLQVATRSQSRIDRIYVSRRLLSMSHSWEIASPGIPTDHCLVSVALADYNEPATGPGRWRVPSLLLTDKLFLEDVQRLGLLALERVYDGDKEERCAQWRLCDFKDAVLAVARRRAKQLTPKMDRRIMAM
ncbi:Endonuclease/exonuclease/phosphatase, partial [Cerioporus squamosus]